VSPRGLPRRWASARPVDLRLARQDRIDQGLQPGLTSAEHPAVPAARRPPGPPGWLTEMTQHADGEPEKPDLERGMMVKMTEAQFAQIASRTPAAAASSKQRPSGT
jgi:hypothetical protein